MSNLDFTGKITLVLALVAGGVCVIAIVGFVLYASSRVIAYGWHRGKTEALEKFYKDKCPDDPEQEIDNA